MIESFFVDITKMRNQLAIQLAAISLGAGILAYFIPDHAVLFLLIQGILLTTVFSIGQNEIEKKIMKEHADQIDDFSDESEAMNDALDNERVKNLKLIEKIKRLEDGKTKH